MIVVFVAVSLVIAIPEPAVSVYLLAVIVANTADNDDTEDESSEI